MKIKVAVIIKELIRARCESAEGAIYTSPGWIRPTTSAFACPVRRSPRCQTHHRTKRWRRDDIPA